MAREPKINNPRSDPFMQEWLALTPSQRVARAWKLRKRLKNIEAIHDAKTFPDFSAEELRSGIAPAPRRKRRR